MVILASSFYLGYIDHKSAYRLAYRVKQIALVSCLMQDKIHPNQEEEDALGRWGLLYPTTQRFIQIYRTLQQLQFVVYLAKLGRQ